MSGESDFSIHSDLSSVAESLKELNLFELSSLIFKEKDVSKLEKYLKIIREEAKKQNREDVLDLLSIQGLIY